MKYKSKTICLILFLLLASFTALAQPTKWEKLKEKFLLAKERGEYRRALAIAHEAFEEAMRNDQRKITWSWYFLGQSYSNQGQYELAETMFNFILPIWKKEYGENSSAVTIIISELALVYREQGDLAKAEQYSKKAIKLITQLDGKRVIWGVSLEKIISLVEQILGTNHPELASSLNSLALSYYKKGSYQEAEALYLRAIEIVEKTFGEEHTELVSYRNNLAELYLARVS